MSTAQKKGQEKKDGIDTAQLITEIAAAVSGNCHRGSNHRILCFKKINKEKRKPTKHKPENNGKTRHWF